VELSDPRPPRWLEWLVARALPRACREHVLGDLHESYTSAREYVTDAVPALAAAIFSQIRRVTPLPFLLLEAVIVYGSIYVAAIWEASEDGPPNVLKIAAASAVVMALLVFCDLYPLRSEIVQIIDDGIVSVIGEWWRSSWLRVAISMFRKVNVPYMYVMMICHALRPHDRLPGGMTYAISFYFLTPVLLTPLRIWLVRRKDRLARSQAD
jgi:hypothetical protein